MSARIAFVVETFLAYDRDTWTPPPEWVDFRLRFFHDFTLKSIKNQASCPARIFCQVGRRYRKKIEAFSWDPDVTVLFDNGREAYQALDCDWICTLRTDSDDLLHKFALNEVKAAAIQLAGIQALRTWPGPDRQVLVFPDYFVWDQINGFLATPPIRPPSLPFFAHLMPRALADDWPRFQAVHFKGQGKDGAGEKTGLRLSPDRICVIKHGQNTSEMKRGKEHPRMTAEEACRAYPESKILTGPEAIAHVLRDFGIGEGK